MACARLRRASSLARFTPMEFFLSSPYRAVGNGMRGCAARSKPRTVSVGSATNSAGATRSSVMRLTKLELAPFSSKRRTSTIPLDTNNTPIPFDYQNAYAKINARIGLTTPDEVFTFELWATNITDKITRGITANTPLRGGAGTRSRIGFVEEPRFYGLTVRAKF